MKITSYCALLSLVFSLNARAQNIDLDKTVIEDKIRRSLKYLESTQVKTTRGTDHFKGEWPSFLSNEARILFIGKKGKKAYDSNCFTTSLIHNILAEVYLNNPRWTNIPPMLDLALENIRLFQRDSTFKFWHILNRPKHISRSKHLRHPEKYRRSRPNHFIYRSRFINSYAHIYDDADDTATGHSALMLNYKVHQLLGNAKESPGNVGPIFANNRDIGRRNINWYNLFYGISSRTYAYLTWFGQEKVPTPWRWFTPRGNQPNMPFGANDVCPVVNANVLKTLAVYDELETEGVTNACDLIARLIQKKNNSVYTVYYPTEYNLEYAISGAIKAGARCEKINLMEITSHLISQQKDDGSWKSEIPNNDLQASLYAINTLLNMGYARQSEISDCVENGIKYVLSQEIAEDKTSHWKAGIFFSGGTIMKKTHVWRSDAYTTALVIEMLNNYLLQDQLQYQITGAE